jgi:nucleoside-diphosphate-sugar epimerase
MSSISENAEKLKSHLQHILSDEDKIVVNGASGWLGSNIAETLYAVRGSSFENNVLLTASSDKVLKLRNNEEVNVHKWSKELLAQFAPTHVMQLAFKTRDHVKNLPLEEYLRLNLEIISSANWMISLPSVKGFLHTSSGAVCGQNTHDAHIDPYGFLKTLEELEFAKNCADLNRNYLGVRIWSTSGAYIKSGGLLAIESLISQALVDNKISVESSRRTYRTYADANEILVASLIGLLIGRTGLYNSGGFEIEIGDLASIVADLAPDTGHQIIRPEFRLAKEDRFCSEDPSIESVLHEIGLTFSSISCQVSKTMEYLKEVR